MKFVALFCIIMVASSLAAETKTTTTVKAPAEISVTLSDGASTQEGHCKVYVQAPTDSVMGKTEVKIGATKFVGTYRSKVFGKTSFVTGGKAIADLKKAHKAHIKFDVTYHKKKYHCDIHYAPNNNCSYSKAYKCKNASFLVASLKFLALALFAAFFF